MATLREKLAAKKQQIAEQTGRRENAFKVPVGSTRVRILPAWTGNKDDVFHHDFGEHFIKDAKDTVKAVYICTNKTFSKACPICDLITDGIADASAVGDTAKKDVLYKSRAGAVVLVNALLVDKDINTPIVLALTPTTFDQCITIHEQNLDPDDDDFCILTSPDKGVDLIITRSGTGPTNTKYTVQPTLTGSKPVPKAVLDKMTNLEEYVSREYEAGLLKASTAVQSLFGPVRAKPKAITSDDQFADADEDVPNYVMPEKSVASDDVLEGSYKEETEESMGDDELDALLEGLE